MSDRVELVRKVELSKLTRNSAILSQVCDEHHNKRGTGCQSARGDELAICWLYAWGRALNGEVVMHDLLSFRPF